MKDAESCRRWSKLDRDKHAGSKHDGKMQTKDELCWKKGYILRIYNCDGGVYGDYRGYNVKPLMTHVTKLNKELGFKLKSVFGPTQAYNEGGGYKLIKTVFHQKNCR